MISIEDIQAVNSDDDLYDLLSSEMSNLMDGFERENDDVYVDKIRTLPKCFWALGALYDLDVSVTLDDLGWHFGNHYSWELAQDTLKALNEIGADEEAAIFSETLKIVKKYWLILGKVLNDESADFSEWYQASKLDDELMPLNERIWALNKEAGLLDKLIHYVRHNPKAALSI